MIHFSPMISNGVSVCVCGSRPVCVCVRALWYWNSSNVLLLTLWNEGFSFFPLLSSLPSPSYWKSWCYKNIVCFFFLLLVFKNYKINITKSSSDHMTTVQSTSAFVDHLVCVLKCKHCRYFCSNLIKGCGKKVNPISNNIFLFCNFPFYQIRLFSAF